MKNIFNKLGKGFLLFVSAGTLVFDSCSKTFLDTDPLSFYEPSVAFSTESGLKAAMAICDRHMKLYYACDHNEMLPLGTEYMFSEMSVGAATDKTKLLCDIANDLTPSSDSGESMSLNNLNRTNSLWYFWKETWKGVMYANTIIKYAPLVEDIDPDIRDAYMGRAYFHRAFRYMALLMQYGDIPLVTTIIDAPKQDYYSTKRDAVLDMLIENMEWAVQHVPNQSDMSQTGMPNKGACKVLLTKIYLARGEYQKAQALCDDLINNCGYSLLTGATFGSFEEQPTVGTTWPITRNLIWDMHRCPNKLRKDNTELIMGLPNSGSDTESFVKMLTMRIMYPFFFNGGVKDVDGVQAMQNYKRNNGNYDENADYMRALGRGIATWRLTHYYNHAVWAVRGKKDAGDMRHSSSLGNWINMEDLKVNNRSSKHYGENLRLFNDDGTLLCNDTIRRWFSMPHYKLWIYDPVNDANVSGSDGNRGVTTGGNGDWYLYRLAEVYLLRAEAKFYQNPSDPSIAEDVNIIRKRAGCQELYQGGQVTIGDIMDERARELYFEEWRNCELTRVSLCLARSGKPDEWGNIYSLDTFDKQEGTDPNGGSYWYQRCIKYGMYNTGVTININATKSQLNYRVDKKNLYWPIPESAIVSNNKGQLHQNFGYDGYDPNVKEWENWKDAAEAEKAK